MLRQKPASWVVATTTAACVLLVVAGYSANFLEYDRSVTGWFRALAGRSHAEYALLITAFGSSPLAIFIWFLAGIPMSFKRWWYELLFLTLAVGGNLLLNPRLKDLFDRPRPFADDPDFTFIGTSFPSGHAMTATALYAGLVVILLPHLSRPQRRVAIAVGAVVIALIAATRIYLGAHYLTDVLGGVAFGLLWLVICELAVASLIERRVI
jgi:membrane-associated phospholipid phosphatase